MNYFSFNNVNSYNYGLYINANTFSAPSMDVETFNVAGRNGDLVVSNNRYNNITASYTVGIVDFKTTVRDLATWLLADGGYHRLEDSIYPDTYRMARFTGDLEAVANALYETGTAVLNFDCKPQRYLVTNTPITFSAGETKTINSLYFTEPLYILSGAGTVTVNDVAMTATSAVTIDCQRMQCYDGDTNLNNSVTLDEFPVLKMGANSVTSSVAMELVPNYWRL